MIEVTLTVPEFFTAIEIGKMRFLASEFVGMNNAKTKKRDWIARMKDEICGACGEMSLGKASGRWFVASVNTFHRVPDCFEDSEVRGTDLPNGSLIVRDDDPGERKYILAIVSAPTVALAGWMYGHECKRDEFLRNPNNDREAWFVPQRCLRPMDELISSLSAVAGCNA
jgi:hypothetical protein